MDIAQRMVRRAHLIEMLDALAEHRFQMTESIFEYAMAENQARKKRDNIDKQINIIAHELAILAEEKCHPSYTTSVQSLQKLMTSLLQPKGKSIPISSPGSTQ